MKKILTMAAACVLLLATATAQEQPNVGDAVSQMEIDKTFGGTGTRGADESNTGWIWYTPERSWYWYSASAGSQQLYAVLDGGATVNTAASNPQSSMINLAVANDNWIAFLWTSSTTWSDSQLWYY